MLTSVHVEVKISIHKMNKVCFIHYGQQSLKTACLLKDAHVVKTGEPVHKIKWRTISNNQWWMRFVDDSSSRRMESSGSCWE